MKTNWQTRIVGSKVCLVPYRKYHVEMYHKWMQDPYLQEMTASEPLTLAEEYAMQLSWLEDPKKCTFIILDKSRMDPIGDVNFFFNDCEDKFNCEIEIMIADVNCRRKGFATEALELMMGFGVEKLNVKRFYCKINDANQPSLNLFENRLGFKKVNYVAAFQETELEKLNYSSSRILNIETDYTS